MSSAKDLLARRPGNATEGVVHDEPPDTSLLARLREACRIFATWQPRLAPRTPQTEQLAEAVASGLGCGHVLWIGPKGHQLLACDVELFWSHDFFGEVRHKVPDEKWRELRELMSQRFMSDGYGGLVQSLGPDQLEWFRLSNVHGLCANLEDLIMYGFCASHGAEVSEAEVTLLAELLELWGAGIYVVGTYRTTDLVLLHGSEDIKQLES